MEERLLTDPWAAAPRGADRRLPGSEVLLSGRQKRSTGWLGFETRNVLFCLLVYKLQLSMSRRVTGGTWNTRHSKLQVRTGSCVSIGGVAAFSSPDLMEVFLQRLAGKQEPGAYATLGLGAF